MDFPEDAGGKTAVFHWNFPNSIPICQARQLEFLGHSISWDLLGRGKVSAEGPVRKEWAKGNPRFIIVTHLNPCTADGLSSYGLGPTVIFVLFT